MCVRVPMLTHAGIFSSVFYFNLQKKQMYTLKTGMFLSNENKELSKLFLIHSTSLLHPSTSWQPNYLSKMVWTYQ